MSQNGNGSEDGNSGNSFKRRSFVKAIGAAGGVAATEHLFATRARAHKPGDRTVVDQQTIPSDRLVQLVRRSLTKPDVANVVPSTIRETVHRGTALEISAREGAGIAFSQNAADESRERRSGGLSADDVYTTGVRHTLADGTELTKVSFGNESRIVSYAEFDTVTDGVQTKAMCWRPDGAEVEETTLILERSSHNGTESTKSAGLASLACECDPGPAPDDGQLRDVCQSIDVDCALTRCGGACLLPCSVGPATCLVCVVASCPYILATCCTNWETECTGCASL